MEQSNKLIFVTGTDTGVGKTILTGLLLLHLRRSGAHALAMKPFCSGDRNDAQLLAALQDGELDIEDINPIFIPQPLAPFAAARCHGQVVNLARVIKKIRELQRKCEWLLIEGIGGVLVPVTKKLTVADLISKLRCETVLVARNQLGTINHTLLSIEALKRRGARTIKVVLMDQARPDFSSASNPLVIRDLIKPIELYTMAFLGPNANDPVYLANYFPKVKKIVAQLLH